MLDFEHPEGKGCLVFFGRMMDGCLVGKRVFWHSSAHVLGEAAERHYGCHLCIGPPTDDGFFYEMAIDERYVCACRKVTLGADLWWVRVVTNADYPALEKVAESAIKDKQKFERLLVSKENLLEMFSVRRRRYFFVCAR